MPTKIIVPAKKRTSIKKAVRALDVAQRRFEQTRPAFAATQAFEQFKTVVTALVEQLEPEVAQARRDMRDLEKKLSNQPEMIWHKQQFTLQTLQKEFADRIPAVERHYQDLQLLAGRMDRLEKKLETMDFKLEELINNLSEILAGARSK